MDLIPSKTPVYKVNQILTSYFRSQIYSLHMQQMQQALTMAQLLNVNFNHVILDD